ncbi:phosphotransferase family protein [Streptomyces endophyticus]|uniref:Aminoglycoside phosphotransferase family protein n=1 Tax=Streptomyces endophyticus TaxID=714166 RepID=A0ABU6F0M5_9ACTN|nr:aminoglycoside phosphotransferase family protein [Streptomyces endophyticus]MEB8337414.1 aminoglycoside phosphotransferase family protein [Streptomyces endophyticus]
MQDEAAVQDEAMENVTANEEPLRGGRITSGVVRVGNTVRRPATASSPFVVELLTHLHHQGFTGAPRHLGFDSDGRETLSHLPGWVPARFQTWRAHQIAAAGTLLRAFHDATRDSHLTGPRSVVCHHDPGPNNTVFSCGVPTAFIDFDTAAPGEPLEDLGYMAWTWCISSKPTAPPPTSQAAQLRTLTDAYGLDAASRPHMLDAVLTRQLRNAACWRTHLTPPPPPVASATQIHERIHWSEREHAYTSTHRSTFAAALT